MLPRAAFAGMIGESVFIKCYNTMYSAPPVRRAVLICYLITCTVKAVVCGGILAVMNDACSTLTLNPARSEDSVVRLPKKSKTVVLGVILNRTTEEGFWLRRTIIKLLRLLISIILPVVVSVRLPLLAT